MEIIFYIVHHKEGERMSKRFSFRNSTGRNETSKDNFKRYLYTTEITQPETPINTNVYIPTIDEPSDKEKNIPYDSTINTNEYIPNLEKQTIPRH